MPLFELLGMDDLIFAINEGILNCLMQVGLIAFDGQQVICTPGDDLLGNGALAAHRINTDKEAFHVQGIKQFRDRRDLVTLRRYFLLTQDQTEPGRKGADHVNGCFATAARTAYRFAVDRNRPAHIRDEAAYPLAEAAFKLLRVEQTEDSQESVFRRNAIFKHEELSQPGSVRTRPSSHVFNRVAVRKHRRDGHDQQLLEVMPRTIAWLARVVHSAQHLHQSRSSRHLLHCPKDESRRDFLKVYKGLS